MRLKARGSHRILAEDFHQGVHRRDTLERGPASQHLVEDRTERINVRGRTRLLGPSLGLLRRDIARRSHDLPGLGVAVFLEPLGEPEIGDLGRAIRREQTFDGFRSR